MYKLSPITLLNILFRRNSFLLDLYTVFFCQVANRFQITHSLVLHHESDSIATFPATKILKYTFGWDYIEGSSFFIRKWD